MTIINVASSNIFQYRYSGWHMRKTVISESGVSSIHSICTTKNVRTLTIIAKSILHQGTSETAFNLTFECVLKASFISICQSKHPTIQFHPTIPQSGLEETLLRLFTCVVSTYSWHDNIEGSPGHLLSKLSPKSPNRFPLSLNEFWVICSQSSFGEQQCPYSLW